MGQGRLDGFLCVDLDIISDVDPKELLRLFGPAVFVVHSETRDGRYHLSLELAEPAVSVDDALLQLGAVIKALPPAGLADWNALSFREFNVGIRLDGSEGSAYIALSRASLEVATELGASLAVTAYVDRDQQARPGA